MQSNTPRTEYTILQDIEALCKSKGYAHALAFLSAEANFRNAEDLVDSKKMSEMHWESILRSEIELLIGFMVKAKKDFFLDTISQDEIQAYVKKSKGLLLELHDSINTKNAEEGMDNIAGAAKPKNTLFREAFFYSAETAYDFQYIDLAYRGYQNDNKWLIKNKGFSVENLKIFVNTMDNIVRNQINDYANIQNNAEPFLLLPYFYIRKEAVIKATKLSENIINNIFNMFSVSSFPCNEKFKIYGDINEMSYRPIIKINDNEFYLLQPHNLSKSFYESPFFWMLNTKYEKDATQNRGNFLEKICADHLRRIFGDANVYENIEIFKENGGKDNCGEIDVLVTYADRAIVIEAKSKKMTLDAIKGITDKVEDDFEEGIKHAYKQSYKCAELLLDSNYTLKYKDGDKKGEELKIKRNFCEVFPMCIVSSTYPGLAIQKLFLLESEEHSIIRKPYIADIFVLDTICEFLNNPIYFLSYQHKRARYFNDLPTSNELSIFSYHLTHNLFIETEDFLHIDDDFCFLIEPSFLARRGYNDSANKTPEGILTKFKGTYFEKIISELNYIEGQGIIDFAYLLLDLSEDAVNILLKQTEFIIERINTTGQVSDFTQVFLDDKSDDSMGVTFFAHPDDIEEATKGLISYCELVKYKHKAKTWFGIILNHLSDGNPLIRGVFLANQPWKRNKKLEKLLKKYPVGNLKKIKQTGFHR